MAKLPKQKNAGSRLSGPVKGRISKKSSKHSGVSWPREQRSENGLDTELNLPEIKKKPSKGDLKLILGALKKEASLLGIRKALKYIPYFLKSEGLSKKLLKEVIRLWAEAGEKVRVVCLLCLIRIYTKLQDKERRQLVIKNLYNSFLEKCRITKEETMSMIGFMRHSLIELYKLDPQIAFKQAQTSCQQLSLTLRNARTHKNEETYKTVLNWQFANCLTLLSQLVISHDDDSPVKSLTHQVIQLNLGSLNLLSSPRYYPYYCHLIENLIGLSKSANLFIPILPLILDYIEKTNLPSTSSRGDSGKTIEAKSYNLDLLNHVSLDEAHSLDYNIAVFDKLYELLLSYLASQSHRIAFPELVLLPCVQLKKWLKKNTAQSAQKLKILLEKIKSDCEKIEEERKSVNFAFTNYTAVDAWEKRMRDSNKLALPKLVINN
mgnify:CR=1 FL=1